MGRVIAFDGCPITHQDLNVDSGSCRLCGLVTSLHCKRCGDYYCSQQCQYMDWSNHRYICFPKPPLVPIHSTANENNVTPAISKIFLKDVRDIAKVIMKRLERIENSLADATNRIIDRCEVTPDESRDFETTTDDARSLKSDLNGSEYSKFQFDNSHEDDIMSIETTKNPIRSDHVTLCIFLSTNRCSVRSKNTEKSVFHEVTKKIHLYGLKARPMKALPKVGGNAIILRFKYYVRVKVLKVFDDNKIRVLFVDYGNTGHCKFSDLLMISREIANLPKYVSIVQLHNVRLIKHTTKISDFLKSFERREYRVEYVKNNTYTNAKLYDVQNNELLNETIVKFFSRSYESSKLASLYQSPRTLALESKPVMKPPFQTHTFSPGMLNIEAVIVDTALIEYGYIACIQKADIGNLFKVQSLLSDMKFDEHPYEPKINEYCIVKYENDWYRGLVVSVVDGGKEFEISFVDFLNEATLTSDCIRRYPENLQVDCTTTLCILDGLPESLTTKQRKVLKNEIKVNDVIRIDCVVLITEKQVALIECNDVLTRLYVQNFF